MICENQIRKIISTEVVMLVKVAVLIAIARNISISSLCSSTSSRISSSRIIIINAVVVVLYIIGVRVQAFNISELGFAGKAFIMYTF